MDIDFKVLEGKHILCAVSGGADSICLLHLLWTHGINVTAAHYEHGIRGEESLRDADFVAKWCAERNIACIVGHGDAPQYASEHKIGLEEAAREMRYEFLYKSAAEAGCDYIATAHNADDNAETILMNLTRGSGMLGLTGIPTRRDIIIRPLLSVSRDEIEAYLESNSLAHIEDSSNQSDTYTRNLIRHKVMPVLKAINPKLSLATFRCSELLWRDEDYLQSVAETFIKEHYDGKSLPAKELTALHPAIASRVIRTLTHSSCSLERMNEILRVSALPERSCIELHGVRLVCEQGRLYFNPDMHAPLPERELHIGDELIIPELALLVRSEIVSYSGEINGLFKTYYLKYENIGSNLFCSGRKNGDRLRPAGRGCSKSLKSLFLEAKYTQSQRDRTLIVRDEKGILLINGLALDERVRPEKGDKALKLSFCDIEENE